MSGLFTINLQNVSARLMISMKFTKVKVNYEIGDTLRKQTTNSNKQNSLQKATLVPAVTISLACMNPKAH